MSQARGFWSAGVGEPDDLRVGEEVVEEGADVLNALRAAEVQQHHADLGHARVH